LAGTCKPLEGRFQVVFRSALVAEVTLKGFPVLLEGPLALRVIVVDDPRGLTFRSADDFTALK
jgi:hypothetical protein